MAWPITTRQIIIYEILQTDLYDLSSASNEHNLCSVVELASDNQTAAVMSTESEFILMNVYRDITALTL